MSGTILRRRDRTARPPRVEHYSSAVNTIAVWRLDATASGTITSACTLFCGLSKETKNSAGLRGPSPTRIGDLPKQA